MSITQTRTGVLATLAAILAASSGCGGSNGLSRSELIARADPICRQANQRLRSSKFDVPNMARLAPVIATAFTQAASELGKLSPPSSMSADWGVIVDGFRRAGVGFQEIGQGAKGLPPDIRVFARSKTLIEGEAEMTKAQRDRSVTAARDGFNDCSRF
jgi:hypothetical protein